MTRLASGGALPMALLCLLAGALLAPPAAEAQIEGSLDGRRITAVEYVGLELLAEDTLAFYLGVQAGDTLDLERLNRSLKELWSRRLVDDIELSLEPDGNGVKLIVTVDERPVLRSVDYVGLKRIGRSDIDDRIARDRIDVGEGLPLARGELQRLKESIEEMYRDKGYRFADVQLVLEQVARGEVRATFTVDEGDKVRIGDIEFEGNEVFSDLRLRWAMKKTDESGIISRVLRKDIYNPANLEEDMVSVRDLYRGAGYKNVLIGDPAIDVRERGDDRRLVLTIPIDEGERWRFGEITIDGNAKLNDEVLQQLFRIRSGDWLRSDAIDEGVEQIEEAYKNGGYIFSRVEPELVEVGDNVADLVVHIEENDQFKVGRIEFEGNTSTRDKVLRRELRVYEGSNVNLGAVRSSIFKINQLGFFKIDENDPVQFDSDTEQKTVNLLFKGSEDNRTELQFGAGYSDFQGFFGQVAFRTKNFRGRGETLGVSAEIGRQRSLFDLSYFVPWFLDKPQSIGAQAFRQELDFDLGLQTFRRDSQGAIFTYGRSYRLFQTFSVSYNFSVFEDQVVQRIPDDDDVLLRDLSLDNSSIRPSWLYNSVDDRFEPTTGERIRVSVEYAGGFLGGNNYFVRPEIGFSYFRPVTNYPSRTVFGLNIEAGWVEPFGTETISGIELDRELSPLERYYLGGENSIRGHRTRSVFVRDEEGQVVDDGGFGLGGDKFFQVNVEYHFLLGGPFRLVAFVDGGNVWADYDELIFDDDGTVIERIPVSQDIDLGNLRWTTGLELRLLVPVFGAPLRFIYARNLDELPGDDFDTFRFSIGAAF